MCKRTDQNRREQTRTDQNRPGQTRTAQDSQGKTRGLLKGSFFAPSKSDCVNFSLCNKERRNKIGGNDDCGGHMVMVMMSSTRVQSQNSRSALVVYNSSLPWSLSFPSTVVALFSTKKCLPGSAMLKPQWLSVCIGSMTLLVRQADTTYPMVAEMRRRRWRRWKSSMKISFSDILWYDSNLAEVSLVLNYLLLSPGNYLPSQVLFSHKHFTLFN